MPKRPAKLRNAIGPLLDDAHALVEATKDVAGPNVQDIRNRLAETLASAKDAYEQVRDKAVEGTQNVDDYIRENPYHGVGIGVGIGLFLGLLLARRR